MQPTSTPALPKQGALPLLRLQQPTPSHLTHVASPEVGQWDLGLREVREAPGATECLVALEIGLMGL